MIKNIAIVSLSSGILGEPFIKWELDIGLKRLADYGLNVIVNNYEVFCWDEDYGYFDNSDETDELWDDETDEGTEPTPEVAPSWSVSVSYLNGDSQEICGYYDLPDRVNELTLELLSLFEDEQKTEDSEE